MPIFHALFRRPREGFTLLEALLTISLMGGMTMIVLTSLDTPGILARTRNAQRSAHLNDLLGAITAYTIDHDGDTPPSVYIPPTPGPAVFSGAYIIASSLNSPRSVFVANLDGDGDQEIIAVAASAPNTEVSYWDRSGSWPNYTWTKHIVDGSSWEGEDVEVADVDGDGKPDIVSANPVDRDVAWWQNLGGSPPAFGARVTIESSYRDVRTVSVADMDGDLDLDVVAGTNSVWESSSVKWWRNNGSPLTGNWSKMSVNNGGIFWFLYVLNEAHAVDVDGDGDRDIVGGGDWLWPYWWVNDGTPFTGTWTRYRIDTDWVNMRGVAAGDLDEDADQDIVGISTSNSVSFWKNDGNPYKDVWPKHVVASNFGGDSIIVADFDSDGDRDLIGASSGGDKLAYFENTGGGNFAATYVVESGAEVNGIAKVAMADLDADNDFDIVAANRDGDTVVWFMNTSLPGPSESAPIGGIEGEFKPLCRQGVDPVECDAAGGVSVNILVPGYIAEIPVDPNEPEGSLLTGYEVQIEHGTPSLTVRAPLAERGVTLELRGIVGVENCLIWDVIGGERQCVLFE